MIDYKAAMNFGKFIRGILLTKFCILRDFVETGYIEFSTSLDD